MLIRGGCHRKRRGLHQPCAPPDVRARARTAIAQDYVAVRGLRHACMPDSPSPTSTPQRTPHNVRGDARHEHHKSVSWARVSENGGCWNDAITSDGNQDPTATSASAPRHESGVQCAPPRQSVMFREMPSSTTERATSGSSATTRSCLPNVARTFTECHGRTVLSMVPMSASASHTTTAIERGRSRGRTSAMLAGRAY